MLRQKSDGVIVPLAFIGDGTKLVEKCDCARSNSFDMIVVGGAWHGDATLDASTLSPNLETCPMDKKATDVWALLAKRTDAPQSVVVLTVPQRPDTQGTVFSIAMFEKVLLLSVRSHCANAVSYGFDGHGSTFLLDQSWWEGPLCRTTTPGAVAVS